MKIIVFGLGKFYKSRKEQILHCPDVEIVAYMDNNKELWGSEIDKIPVVSPDSIDEISFDGVWIMSIYEKEIYEQLIRLGVPRSKIQFWKYRVLSGTRDVFYGKGNEGKIEKELLIISTGLNYDGGSLAVVYAALALERRGYGVVLAAPDGDSKFIGEVIEQGITVHICPSLPYVYDAEIEWIRQFDAVIVNVFQMIQTVIGVGDERPTLWWIHEPKSVFDMVRVSPWNCVAEKELGDIRICAVSSIPRENFNSFYPGRIKEILHYGILDMGMERSKEVEEKEKIVFAIIGLVCERKAQDIFCRAVEKLCNNGQAEFWIIGYYGNDPYGEEIRKMSSKIKDIKMTGQLTRMEIYDMFPQIDVVVCASREDPLPIVMTEGMMFGKVCITTEATGTADFIRDGENGFVIPSENADALREKMEWIIENKGRLADMGMNARKTYEKYFSMEVFGENLERKMLETKKQWYAKKRDSK